MDQHSPNRPLSRREVEKYRPESQDGLDLEGMTTDECCDRGLLDIDPGQVRGCPSSKLEKSYGDQGSQVVLNGIFHLMWAVGEEMRRAGLHDLGIEMDSMRSLVLKDLMLLGQRAKTYVDYIHKHMQAPVPLSRSDPITPPLSLHSRRCQK